MPFTFSSIEIFLVTVLSVAECSGAGTSRPRGIILIQKVTTGARRPRPIIDPGSETESNTCRYRPEFGR